MHIENKIPTHNNLYAIIQSRRKYSELPAPIRVPIGSFEVNWIGPNWFVRLAVLALGFAGFKNWWGKEFISDHQGMNLFIQNHSPSFLKKFPMDISISNSNIDSFECIKIKYPPNAGFPWYIVIDEFRELDKDTLLGMSYVKFFPGMALPFLLVKNGF
ncbi:MAG: hypothetical protein SH817_07730 [Leptospira sp.]|nr:hypothetical protein [Leptospira sp.]